jgi:predicted nucleic acid-binding protein
VIFALDTNVVSALRRSLPDDAAVAAWAASVDHSAVYLPTFVLMELRYGIERVRRRGDLPQAEILGTWLTALVAAHDGRVLDFTADAAMIAGDIMASPDAPGLADCVIAATARAHGATVVTRNVKDFARTGAATLDPWHHRA